METEQPRCSGSDLRNLLEFLRERVNAYKWRFNGPFLNYQESRQKTELDLLAEVEEKWGTLLCPRPGGNDTNVDRLIKQAFVLSCVRLAERVAQSIYITAPSTGPKDLVGDLSVPDGCYNHIVWKRMLYNSGPKIILCEDFERC